MIHFKLSYFLFLSILFGFSTGYFFNSLLLSTSNNQLILNLGLIDVCILGVGLAIYGLKLCLSRDYEKKNQD